METIIKAGNTDHAIDTKPLTLVFHEGFMNISVKDEDVVTITPQDTLAAASTVSQATWGKLRGNGRFCRWFGLVFDRSPADMADLRTESTGVKHVVGLLLLINRAIVDGKRPFIQFPETYLHPKLQCGLGDLLIELSV